MRIISDTTKPTQIQCFPVLANITPPRLRRNKNTNRILNFVNNDQHLPLSKDIMAYPPKRLKSRHHIWESVTQSNSSCEIWKERWKTSDVRNFSLISNPEIRVPSFGLPRRLWTTLSRIRTEQGKCGYNLFKWAMNESPYCKCGELQSFTW